MKFFLDDIKEAKFVELVYKTGFRSAIEYKSWGKLQSMLSHKRGPKPIRYRFYTNKGIFLLDLANYWK